MIGCCQRTLLRKELQQMQEIQKKYKDDKEKQSAELMKLYQVNAE
jgi:YidC/Oxa1 family membrane protein insertase